MECYQRSLMYLVLSHKPPFLTLPIIKIDQTFMGHFGLGGGEKGLVLIHCLPTYFYESIMRKLTFQLVQVSGSRSDHR